jgi:hypothetical protein
LRWITSSAQRMTKTELGRSRSSYGSFCGTPKNHNGCKLLTSSFTSAVVDFAYG